MLSLQQKNIVPFAIAQNSPRLRAFISVLNVYETLPANCLDSILNVWNLQKNYCFVAATRSSKYNSTPTRRVLMLDIYHLRGEFR